MLAMTNSEPLVQHEHARGRAQTWGTVDDDIRSFVAGWVDQLGAELSPAGFVGAYLHGSLAMGELSDQRPLVGDLEMSVLRRADAINFHQPLPFQVHYSAEWKEAIRGDRLDFTIRRTDPELAAYCTAVRRPRCVSHG